MHVWSLRRGVTGYSTEEGESRPRASFYGRNYAFVLLNKSFKINTRCFCDVLVFDDEMFIATRCKRACSIARHVTVKHGHSQCLLHVYTKKRKDFGRLVHFLSSSSCSDVLRLDVFAFFFSYFCLLCLSTVFLSVCLVGKFKLSAHKTFTVSN